MQDRLGGIAAKAFVNPLFSVQPQTNTPAPAMTRFDLISRLAHLHPQLLAKNAALAVVTILDAMAATLSKGGRIEIRGFGSFSLNYRPSRVGRNPKTG